MVLCGEAQKHGFEIKNHKHTSKILKIITQIKYFKISFFLDLNLIKKTIDIGIINNNPSYLTTDIIPIIKNDR